MPTPPGRGLVGWNVKQFPASERGPWITDCARIAERRQIRDSTRLPDCGLFWRPGRLVSAQPGTPA
eukprot:6580474-Alexandrium_andersonii.AAC.1